MVRTRSGKGEALVKDEKTTSQSASSSSVSSTSAKAVEDLYLCTPLGEGRTSKKRKLPSECEEVVPQKSRKRTTRKLSSAPSDDKASASQIADQTPESSVQNDGPLKGREKEFLELKKLIEDYAAGATKNIYISGAPGTGKTMTVRRVLKSVRAKSREVNCMAMAIKSEKQLLKAVHPEQPTLPAFKRFLEGLSEPFVLLLDEIDQLGTNSRSLLYKAFRYSSSLPNFILIGIANSVDLTERLLPKLKLMEPPHRFVFAPYTKDQIVTVLKDEICKSKVLMTPDAVELCARKVSATSGDMRSALHVLKQSKSLGIEVDGRQVLGALSNVYSSPLARARLPLHPCLLLAICLRLSSQSKLSTVSHLFSAYEKVCSNMKLPILDEDERTAALSMLESQSFLVVHKEQIRLQVDAGTASKTISNTALIADCCIEMSAAGNWCLIESDPGVFTELIRGFGVKGVQVEELYSLEENEFVDLRPVYGLVFLFKWRPGEEPSGQLATTFNNVYFAQQVITNACASQALVNLLLNVKDPSVELGPMLSGFKSFSADFDPANRGLCLSNADDIRAVHNSFGRQHLFELDIRAPDKEEDNYHFVTYVPVDGKVIHSSSCPVVQVYELDGLREAPVEVGTIPDGGDWVNIVRPAIQERIQRFAEGEVHFNLMAVVKDRRVAALKRLEELAESGMDTEELAQEVSLLQARIDEEDAKMKKYRVENTRRRHNYMPFIVELLKVLAKEGKLVPLVESAIEKRKAEKEKLKSKA